MEDTTTSTVGNAKNHKQLYVKYLNSLNKKTKYTSEDISILLKNINSFGVETEKYSKFANRAAQTLKKSIRAELEKYLKEFKNKYFYLYGLKHHIITNQNDYYRVYASLVS